MAKITHKGMWIELKSLDKDAKSKYILCNVFLFAGALLFGVHLAAVGGLGIDRFYSGSILLGVLKLFTLGGLGLWWLIDLIMLVTGNYKDGDGNPIVYN